MIHVGFTGTRNGMTSTQIEAVTMIMRRLVSVGSVTVHHGDCLGADAEFDKIAKKLGAATMVHPGPDRSMRAFCDGDKIYPSRSNFARNRLIVGLAMAMIAAPYEPEHRNRGGTWYTIDFAAKHDRPMAVVLQKRDGVTIEFSGGWAWPNLPLGWDHLEMNK